MKQRLMMTALAWLAASMPAHADWEYVASSDFYARYIDPDSARREGDIVNIWELDDKAEQDRHGVYSLRARTDYDCVQRAYRIAHLSGHSKPQTEGRVIFSHPMRDNWKPVVPGSLGEATLARLCSQ